MSKIRTRGGYVGSAASGPIRIPNSKGATQTPDTIPTTLTIAALPTDGIRAGSEELARRRHREIDNLYERCQWYELALMRHGFTAERLMKLARKVANDALRLRGATLQDRFDDLASRLQIVGLEASLRYDPTRHHASYGSNGGEPFASYVADVMSNRVVDYFRSKAEGFGDRRYGNDDRYDLTDDPDPADHNFDFEQMVGEREGARWQMAAEAQGCELSYFIVTSVSIATDSVLGSSTEPWRSPTPRYQRSQDPTVEDSWGWVAA